jgi:DNA-binding IclR family transcriptional regulator
MYEKPENSGVKSAIRALELLEILGRNSSGATFSELLVATGYPKASLHALLGTFLASDWARLSSETRRYMLGMRAWEVGVAYRRTAIWEDRVREIMAGIRDELGETVQVAVMSRMEALYIAKVDGRHMLRLDSHVGQRLEPHATGVGKVLLAGLEAKVLDKWLKGRKLQRYTPQTITEHAAFRRELLAIRENGYAIDNEERTVGACCVAVPLTEESKKTIAAVSVSSPSVRFTQANRQHALDVLKRYQPTLSSAVLDHALSATDNDTKVS